MELWHDDPEDALRTYLINDLTLLRPPAFIYAASLPPGAAAAARRRGGGAAGGGSGGAAAAGGGGGEGGGGAGEEDGEGLVGYGCYAAVSCVDVRALAALRLTLGSVLADRHWQVGVGREGRTVESWVGRWEGGKVGRLVPRVGGVLVRDPHLTSPSR